MGGQLAAVLAAVAPFAHCPIGAPVAGHRPLGQEGVGACVQLTARRGFMRIGTEQQELTHPIVEQFGFLGDAFLPPADGTPWMTSSPEQVPGGMVGVPLGSSTDVRVQVQPAGPMRFSLFEPTVLPVRIRLYNDWLGPTCTIGPIRLTLQPDVSHADVAQQAVGMRFAGLVAADTTFAVPRSQGCNGGGLVDAKLGLPSPAGRNAVRLEVDANVASAASVARARRLARARRPRPARRRAPGRRHAPRRP